MKKLNFTLLLLILSVSAFAQINFKQVLPPAPAPQIIPAFTEVDEGDIAYADVDGINGLDVLITGSNSANELIATLYLNDGDGNYTAKSGTPFTGVKESSVEFADIDANGSMDVLITGLDGTASPTANLYTNDGNGNFTLVAGTTFDGVRESSIAFADVDGANGPDVLITGRNSSSLQIAKLYLNDGSGTFTELVSVPFNRVNKGAVAFADVDGNSTQDVVITGFNNINEPVTELYTNDGTADFTAVAGTPFVGVRDSDVAFADVDGVNGPDLLISGYSTGGTAVTKLYTNDGSASFTEVAGTPFAALGFSDLAFANVDAANGPDILLSGINATSQPVTKLYTNGGSGNYTEVAGTSFVNVSRGAIAFLDIDADNDPDLVIAGRNNTSEPITETYVNDGSGNYAIAIGTPFEGLYVSDQAFADIDGNGSQDIIITGQNDDTDPVTNLYTNDGSGNFTLVSGTPFTGLTNSSVVFVNVDGVNGPDVIISGFNNNAFEYVTEVYINDGSGNFTEDTGAGLKGLAYGDIAVADVDGSGSQDLIITGFDLTITQFTILYTNDGSGNFTEVTGQPFSTLRNSSVAFADVDGINGPDIILSGRETSSTGVTELYLNDGTGDFTLDTGTPFEGVRNASISVADVDGGGSLDLIVTGLDDSNAPVASLYTNNGSGTFTEEAGTPFEPVDNGSVIFIDVDGINGNDVILTGENASGTYIAKLYINDGSGTFTEETEMPFEGVYQGALAIADIDSDGLTDVMITGRNNAGLNISKLYENTTDFVPPSFTSGTTASVNENVETSFYTATADEEVTFSLGSAKDEAFFRINNGQLSFLDGADFENPLDANGDNEYLVDIIATDQGKNEVTQQVAVTVLNVDESGPAITSPATATVVENSTSPFYTATADEASTFSLGSSKDEAFFTVSTDAISFTSGADFENPTDANTDNVYLIDLIATDIDGNSSTLEVAITVTDADEVAPTITSAASLSVDENTTGTIYTATADETVTFSLGNSKDEDFFSLTFENIAFVNAPDFETPLDADANNVYLVDIIATDGSGNSSTQEVAITVTDVAETGPTITSASAVSVEENTTEIVYVITTDVASTYSLGSSKDEGLFTLDGNGVSFASAPDFEAPADANADNVYLLDVIATDGDGNSTTKAVSITVTDVNESGSGPTITSAASASVEENTTSTVYTITADVAATFSLGTGKDESLFTLSTDAISFTDAPDFENPLDANADNVYVIDVVATDGDGNSTTKTVSITVTDVAEAGPVITSAASATIEENSTATAYTITTDVAATYSLGSSKDESFFTLASDAVSFTEAADFENPLDANADNVYVIDVIATDGDGNSTTKTVSITVTDVAEAGPVITSAGSISVEENSTGTAYTITTDVTATYSLGSSKDEGLFTLSGAAISFNNSPDFENPLDANADNVYQLDVIATDGDGNSTTKALSISVTDIDEGPVASVKEILFEMYPNPVQNTLYIKPVNMAKDAKIHILDASGRLQKVIPYLIGQEQEINVSNLASGVYILAVHSDSKQMQLKFVKQ